jgi:hypothetical protein
MGLLDRLKLPGRQGTNDSVWFRGLLLVGLLVVVSSNGMHARDEAHEASGRGITFLPQLSQLRLPQVRPITFKRTGPV